METHATIDIHTQHDLADIALCKEIYDTLEKHYPGHPWAVGADHAAGVAHIRLNYEDMFWRLDPFGYRLHIKNLGGPITAKRAMQAGGEILERYHLARGRAHAESEKIYQECGLDRGS